MVLGGQAIQWCENINPFMPMVPF